MRHAELWRTRLLDRPLAVARRAAETLVMPPAKKVRASGMLTAEELPPPRGWVMTDGGIAHLPIVGPLVQRGDWLSSFFGIVSYDEIAATVEDAFTTPGVRGVLVEIDSPGGEVAGLFDLLSHIEALKMDSGKPLWAIAREQALSAACAIASVADRLLVTQTGEVGSIGVIAVHVDRTAQDKMEGEKYTLVHAGAKKLDGNPHIPLSPGAEADLQADVDDLYGQLVGQVARGRGMKPETIAATEAAVYRGQHALDAGLADGIATLQQAHANLLAALDAPAGIAARAGRKKPQSTNSERTETMALKPAKREDAAATGKAQAAPATPEVEPTPEAHASAEAPAANPTPAAPLASNPAPAAATPVAPPSGEGAPDIAAQIRAEAAEIAEIAAQAARLGLEIDASDALRNGVKPDALRASVLSQLAARGEAAAISPVAPPAADTTPKESPLIAAAERAREQAVRGTNAA